MKTYQYIIPIVINLVQSLNIHSQELKVGDILPNVTVRNLYNGPADSINLSETKSKLILLDFWGTGCLSCLKSFPKLDSIKERFSKDVQIILINRESKDSTLRYLAKRKNIRMPKNVPFLSSDTVLHRLFPHVFVPHLVWIDSNRTVISITYGENATVDNVSAYLKRKSLAMVEKKDTINKDYSEEELWMAQTALNSNALPYYSYIANYFPGTRGGAGIRSEIPGGPTNQIYIEGGTILELYATAFAEWYKYPFRLHSNTIILKVSDSSKYLYPKNINELIPWLAKNGYSYRLRVPEEKASQLFMYMKNDLERYFGLKARIIKKEIPCIVVSRDKKVAVQKKHSQSEIDNSLNLLWSRLSWYIKMKLDDDASPEPFINLFNEKPDFTLLINKENWERWDHKNLKPLQEELKRNGITISRRLYTTDVLVISE